MQGMALRKAKTLKIASLWVSECGSVMVKAHSTFLLLLVADDPQLLTIGLFLSLKG